MATKPEALESGRLTVSLAGCFPGAALGTSSWAPSSRLSSGTAARGRLSSSTAARGRRGARAPFACAPQPRLGGSAANVGWGVCDLCPITQGKGHHEKRSTPSRQALRAEFPEDRPPRKQVRHFRKPPVPSQVEHFPPGELSSRLSLGGLTGRETGALPAMVELLR